MEEIHQKLEELGKKFPHRLPGQQICHGMLLSQYMPKTIIDKIPGFKLYDSDIIVAGYPKSGTTWLQEIVYLIAHDGDTSSSEQTPNYLRTPLLEDRRFHAMIENNGHRRIFKTHITSNMLPQQIHEKKDAKIVYIVRNPKDTAVSLYHFYKSCAEVGNFDGSWTEFLEMFEEGYVPPTRWFEHVLGWWQLRDLPNLLIVKYEDVQKDPAATIVRIANFLGKRLDPSSLETIVDFTSFQSMKSNPMTNFSTALASGKMRTPFMRKGQVGDWKRHFTVAQSEHFDELYTKTMNGIDLKLVYDEA